MKQKSFISSQSEPPRGATDSFSTLVANEEVTTVLTAERHNRSSDISSRRIIGSQVIRFSDPTCAQSWFINLDFTLGSSLSSRRQQQHQKQSSDFTLTTSFGRQVD